MTFIGIAFCVLGGLAGAFFAFPFRGIRGWRYECQWFVYSVAGLVAFPLLLGLVTCPNLFGVISGARAATLAKCVGFGALWGLGGLTWGLMLRYLGIGLGTVVGCGLCSSVGTLLPPVIEGRAADLVNGTAALLTLGSVAVSLVGIVLIGLAGTFKEGDLSEEDRRKAVADFDFRKGISVAVFSGLACSGLNFGLQSGLPLEEPARQAGVGAAWVGIPALVVVLWGGFAVNLVWCLCENFRNGSFRDYVAPTVKASLPLNFLLAASAGVVWACQSAFQKIGEPALGDIRFVSFALVMGACVMFSTLLGVLLGEWRGTGPRTKSTLAAGVFVLLVSIGIAVAAKGIQP